MGVIIRIFSALAAIVCFFFTWEFYAKAEFIQTMSLGLIGIILLTIALFPVSSN